MTRDAEQEAQKVKGLSRALLGSSSRLLVAADLARQVGRYVYVRDIARRLGLNDPDVKRDLEKFVEGGIMRHHGRATRNTTDNYEPLPSVYWDMASSLLTEARRVPSDIVDKAPHDSA